MLPADPILEQARKARDPRFDGRFFIGVRTTGIYCRPVCPVRMPRAENVVFFDNAAAATEAGFRPCLRCRPEASPGTPAWRGTSTTVSRALRLINEGALDDGSVSALSDRLGVTSRHLNRLFTRHLGASPKAVAQTRRLQFAKKLIDQTRLPMTEIALAAGYGSIRRFNDHFQQTYQRSPGSLRKEFREEVNAGVCLKLPYREPFDFRSLLAFYELRATPGVETVETVEAGQYSRQFGCGDLIGTIRVVQDTVNSQLLCHVDGGSAGDLMQVMNRVKRMFDVDAVPEEINAVLMRDAGLRKLVRRNPGIRLPGAFDEFEIAVRAVVGQQVSVKGATTVMGRIVELYGSSRDGRRAFPSPEQLAEIRPGTLPMPAKRESAIRSLASAILNGDVSFDMNDDEFYDALVALPGIGPWTADYIAMRAKGNPDAFLAGDLVIRKVASAHFGIDRERDLLARAEQWRPWRGYAGMHLWRHAATLKS